MSKSIGGKNDHHRHTLAILLSIPLNLNCFGFTTFAEDIVSVSITVTLSESLDEEIFEDVFLADVEEPVEEIEIPLSLESLAGEERRNPRESSEEGWLPDEDLFTDGLSSEGVSVTDEESAFEETSAPFEQTYTISQTDIEEDAVEATDVINALVVWGDMLFSCREKNTDQGFSFYWVCENGSNTITVTNTSEATPIRAFYNYKPNVDGFGAPLYAFHSAEEAENAGKEMTHDGHDVHNLAEGFEGDVIAPGETEIWYVIFTDAPDVERALSEEDYLSVGRLSATFASAE